MLVVAIAVRAAATASWWRWPGSAVAILDPADHLDAAARIAGGDLAWGDRTWTVAPGFAYLFAAARVVGGEGTAPPLVALLLFDLAVVELVRRLGARLGGPIVGLVAGLAAALSPSFVFHDLTLLGVSPAAAGLALALWLGLDDRPGRWRAAVAGAALGFAAYFRPNLLLLWPVIALAAAWAPVPARDRALRAALVVVGLAVMLSPALIRNRVVGGEWVPLSANAGANLAMAQTPGLRANFPPPVAATNTLDNITRALHERAEREAGRPLRPGEADAWWRAEARARIARDPGGAVDRTVRRLHLALATFDVQDHYAYHARRRDDPVLGRLPELQILLPGLAVAGVGLGLGLGRRRETAIVALAAVGVAVSIAPFVVVERYRLAGHVAWLPLAAAGAVALARTRDPGWALAALSATVLFSVDPFRGVLVVPDAVAVAPAVGWSDHEGRHREADEASMIATAFVRAGDRAAAEPFYRRAVAIDPTRVRDRVNLAVVLLTAGKPDEGVLSLVETVKAFPEDTEATLTLCGVLLQMPDTTTQAVTVCGRAAQLAPDRWEPLYQLAMAQWATGELEAARRNLTKVVAMSPGNERARGALARVTAAREAEIAAKAGKNAVVVDPGAVRVRARGPGLPAPTTP